MKTFMLNPLTRAVKLALAERKDEFRAKREMERCCSACATAAKAAR